MRAGFFFTLQILSRSGAHRLTMAIAVAIGLALKTVALQGVDVRGALENPRVMTGLLAVQPTVVLVLLIAFRHSARVPSDLGANWAFQMAWAGDPHPYIAGVKRAAFVAVVCPALLVLLPLHLALLGFWTAGVHAACGLFIAIAALETLMLGFRTLPFASGYVAGGNLKAWVPVCIVGFWPVTHVLAGIERLAMGDAGAIAAFVARLTLFSAGVRMLGRRQRRSY